MMGQRARNAGFMGKSRIHTLRRNQNKPLKENYSCPLTSLLTPRHGVCCNVSHRIWAGQRRVSGTKDYQIALWGGRPFLGRSGICAHQRRRSQKALLFECKRARRADKHKLIMTIKRRSEGINKLAYLKLLPKPHNLRIELTSNSERLNVAKKTANQLQMMALVTAGSITYPMCLNTPPGYAVITEVQDQVTLVTMTEPTNKVYRSRGGRK